MKTVVVAGTFDFLHRGHISFLEQARKYGDHLVVIIARDSTVKKIKGRAPIHNEKERQILVKSISIVDRAVLGDPKDPYEIIMRLRPQVICLGYDQTHVFARGLTDALKRRHMKTRVVTLKPFQPKRLKSSRLLRTIAHVGTKP